MKKVPAVLIATLVGLAGCSSSGTSFKAEEEKQVNTATTKPAQGDKAEAKADKAETKADKAGASSEAGAEKPARPAQPAQAEKPAETAQPAKPAEPAQPEKPAQPEQPAQPTQPEQPAQPEEPTAPVQPAHPEEPLPTENPSVPDESTSAPDPKPQSLPLEDRKLQVVPSSEGGEAFRPVKDDSTGLAEYMSGPVHYNLSATTFDNIPLSGRSEPSGLFATGETIDPSAVRHLVLTGDDGTVLGRFQFINQNFSSYGNFMATFNAVPGLDDPEDITPEALAFYVAQPTTIEQFNKQSGTATYRGKVLGYQDGPKSPTSHQEAMANVEFNVDFAQKTISGRIAGDERFDGLVKYHHRFTDDEDEPTARGEALSHVDLNLKPTPILQLSNGAVGFGVHPEDTALNYPRALIGTVTVMDGENEQELTNYGGVFAGPDAQEVVGQIGGGEERLIFGATRGE